jgi:cytochrome c556
MRFKLKIKFVITLLLSFLLVSCTKKEPSPYIPYLSISELMQWVIDPAADRIWDSVAWYSTLKGEKMVAPHSQADWDELRNSAATLMEASNLLMIDQRAKDNGAWNTYARALGLEAKKTLSAVQAKDVQAVFDAGTAIDAACEACHQKYAYFGTNGSDKH